MLTIDICYSQLTFFVSYLKRRKKSKSGKRWNTLKKRNSLKKGKGVPLLNFKGDPGVPLLNFEGGPGVPLLNFRGVPGPTFKLWLESRVPGPEVSGPGVLVPLLYHALRTKIAAWFYFPIIMCKAFPIFKQFSLSQSLIISFM